MATVYKRSWTYKGEEKTGWCVRYADADGKRRQQTCKTKKEADRLRLKIETDIDLGNLPSADTPSTFAEVCEKFIRHYEQRVRDGQASQSRYTIIKSVIDKYLIPTLGKKHIRHIGFGDLEETHKKMRKRVSPMTARQYMLVGKQIEDYGIRHNYVVKPTFTPFARDLKGIKPPKVRTFQVDDVRRILAAANVRLPRYRHHSFMLLRCTVNLAVFCGLRFGEIMALTRENVDLVNRVIKVRHNLTKDDVLKSPKTDAGVRDVPMPQHVAYLVQNWMDTWRRPERRGLIFRMPDGAMIEHTNHRDLWLGLLNRAGVVTPDGPDRDVFHFHALRHFNASLLIAMGMPVTDVAQLLGHEKFDMTLSTYAHPLVGKAQRADASERLARMFNHMSGATEEQPLITN